MRFSVIGHRGAAGHAPENTAPSFELAINLRVDAVELDLHLSRDGVPVVIHDATVDRTTDRSGVVGELTSGELKKLDAGAWFDEAYRGTRLLFFEEALDLIGGRVPLVVEVKEKMRVPALLDQLLIVLEASKENAVTLSSFSIPALRQAVLQAADVPRSWLIPSGQSADLDHVFRTAESFHPFELCPNALEVDKEWVQRAHAHGYRVRTWGVPSRDTKEMTRAMRHVICSGADGTTADFPDAMQTTLKAMAHLEGDDA